MADKGDWKNMPRKKSIWPLQRLFPGARLKDKAEMFYNKLIDKNPYSAPYWFGLARCYFEQQLFDKAIEACDYAIVVR